MGFFNSIIRYRAKSFVITDYNGYDPEVNTDRNIGNVTSYGIDYLSYPKARSIIFGLNVSF